MSTAIPWQVDDIDDALAADFDGSLSGLGMELGTSSFNMSDALMALPTLKNELNQHQIGHHHTSPPSSSSSSHNFHPLHHHFLYHQANSSSSSNGKCRKVDDDKEIITPNDGDAGGGGGGGGSAGSCDSDDNARHSPIQQHSHYKDGSITKVTNGNGSNANTNTINGHNGNESEPPGTSSSLLSSHLTNSNDERPIAVVHGKKNRLASCHDEELVATAIKRFCVSQERDNNGDSLHRFLLSSPQSLNGYKDTLNDNDCNHDVCLDEYRCLQRHSSSVPDLRSTNSSSSSTLNGGGGANAIAGSGGGGGNCGNHVYSSGGSSPSSYSISASSTTAVLTQILSSQAHCSMNAANAQEQRSPLNKSSNEFQYVLGAATSMATKLHEETMTYLNQGQSYEIKLKKLGDLSEMRGKILKSTIRVGFHERRLQYMEKDLIDQWKQSRQSDRILEIDIPLSYGVFDVVHDYVDINRCEFLWDPTKETGLFVKLNCISTEFTPKKHGGEKGVPFRLIIETSMHNASQKCASSLLHAASCQVKVFKPKGADRKHKTDREKMGKRPKMEQEKYQPSYDCTVFNEYPLDSLYWSTSSQRPASETSSPVRNQATCLPITINGHASSQSPTLFKERINETSTIISSNGSSNNSNTNTNICTFKVVNRTRMSPEQDSGDDTSEDVPIVNGLSSDSKASETTAWLKRNRFDEYVRTFANFSGTDLLRLNREDLIQICGLTDGIRLYNALNLKGIRPRLTLFVSNPNEQIFHAIYMESYSINELKAKLAQLFTGDVKINRLCLNGPSDIKVLITDDVLRNLTDESMFLIHIDSDSQHAHHCNATLHSFK